MAAKDTRSFGPVSDPRFPSTRSQNGQTTARRQSLGTRQPARLRAHVRCL